nr:YsnF/AvaK domain-containing protein [Nannocystis sp.]
MTRPAIMQVTDPDGVRGIIDTTATGWDPGLPHAEIELVGGGTVVVPTASLELQPDGILRFPHSLRELVERSGVTTVDDEHITIPVIAESLRLTRRLRETGRVRIHKQVHERQETVDLPLLHETTEVEHVAINREVDGPVSIRQEGDTTIIPVLEEVLVVEKRWILREELHVRVRRSEHHEPQVVTLRSEQVTVENLPTPSRERSPSPNRREP